MTRRHQDEVSQKHSRKGDKLDEADDTGGRENRTPAVCQRDTEVLDFASRRQHKWVNMSGTGRREAPNKGGHKRGRCPDLKSLRSSS